MGRIFLRALLLSFLVLLAPLSSPAQSITLDAGRVEAIGQVLTESKRALTEALAKIESLTQDLSGARRDLALARGSLTQVRKLLSESMQALLTAKEKQLLSQASYAKALEELTKYKNFCDDLERKIEQAEASVIWAAILAALAGLGVGYMIAKLTPP